TDSTPLFLHERSSDLQGLVRFFVKPAAFLAANWAAMLGILTIAGIVPALSGATRVTGDLRQYEDSAFRSALTHIRSTLRRDAPRSEEHTSELQSRENL